MRVNNCSEVYLENCDLYGCGTFGVTASYCEYLSLDGCDIYHCTDGCLDLDSTYCTVNNTEFRDCDGYTMFTLWDSTAEFHSSSFHDLTGDMFYLNDYSAVYFEDCELDDAALEGTESSAWFGEKIFADWNAKG